MEENEKSQQQNTMLEEKVPEKREEKKVTTETPQTVTTTSTQEEKMNVEEVRQRPRVKVTPRVDRRERDREDDRFYRADGPMKRKRDSNDRGYYDNRRNFGRGPDQRRFKYDEHDR